MKNSWIMAMFLWAGIAEFFAYKAAMISGASTSRRPGAFIFTGFGFG